MSLAADLSAFLCDAQPRAGADAAQAIMRLSLYDWMVCGLAGRQTPVAIAMRDMAQPGGPAAVFGTSDRTAPATAAWINGACSHALDYDDTHFAHIGHPSVAVFPAVFALAGDGEEALWAALFGAEVSVRIGLWLGRDHYQVGYHQTATSGAFGAAAAAARLLDLTLAETEAAFGLASTQAAGLKSQFGTMGKPYHAGLAARTGVEAALLAKAGFDTRGAGLDGPQGFCATHHGAGDLSAFDGIGNAWHMEDVSHKFHACCHGLHAMLNALGEAALDPEDLEAMEVRTHPRWLTVCNIQDPSTGLETKFSFRHTAAMAILGRSTAALDSYTDAAAQDPALADLRARITVKSDDTLPETASEVHVTRAGRVDRLHHDLAAPLTYADRMAKLRQKGAALLGAEMEARLWAATHGHETVHVPDILDLMSAAD